LSFDGDLDGWHLSKGTLWSSTHKRCLAHVSRRERVITGPAMPGSGFGTGLEACSTSPRRGAVERFLPSPLTIFRPASLSHTAAQGGQETRSRSDDGRGILGFSFRDLGWRLVKKKLGAPPARLILGVGSVFWGQIALAMQGGIASKYRCVFDPPPLPLVCALFFIFVPRNSFATAFALDERNLTVFVPFFFPLARPLLALPKSPALGWRNRTEFS